MERADLAAANWAWANDRRRGAAPIRCPGQAAVPADATGRGPIGVIGIDDDRTVRC